MKNMLLIMMTILLSSCAFFNEFWEPSDVLEALKPKALFEVYFDADKLLLMETNNSVYSEFIKYSDEFDYYIRTVDADTGEMIDFDCLA